MLSGVGWQCGCRRSMGGQLLPGVGRHRMQAKLRYGLYEGEEGRRGKGIAVAKQQRAKPTCHTYKLPCVTTNRHLFDQLRKPLAPTGFYFSIICIEYISPTIALLLPTRIDLGFLQPREYDIFERSPPFHSNIPHCRADEMSL